MSGSPRIDLNADLGELPGARGRAADEALLAIVSSANIACGLHAGDATTMDATVRAARRHGVAIGAHPSYPDSADFGRKAMDLPEADVEALVLYQIGALEVIARANGTALAHVKPHGALYNAAARDGALAAAIARAVRRAGGGLRLYGLAGSALGEAARAAGIPFVEEAFCDRRYEADGTLVSRAEADAIIAQPAQAARQAVDIVRTQRATARGGGTVAIRAGSLCVHGDTPGAAELAAAVRAAIEGAGVRVAAPE